MWIYLTPYFSCCQRRNSLLCRQTPSDNEESKSLSCVSAFFHSSTLPPASDNLPALQTTDTIAIILGLAGLLSTWAGNYIAYYSLKALSKSECFPFSLLAECTDFSLYPLRTATFDPNIPLSSLSSLSVFDRVRIPWLSQTGLAPTTGIRISNSETA